MNKPVYGKRLGSLTPFQQRCLLFIVVLKTITQINIEYAIYISGRNWRNKCSKMSFPCQSLRLALIKMCAIPSGVHCNYLFVRISHKLQKMKSTLMKKNCCRGGEARLKRIFSALIAQLIRNGLHTFWVFSWEIMFFFVCFLFLNIWNNNKCILDFSPVSVYSPLISSKVRLENKACFVLKHVCLIQTLNK